VAGLAAAVDALAPLSPAQQRQVAAVLHGYLAALPGERAIGSGEASLLG
jgi:hypothetical protein